MRNVRLRINALDRLVVGLLSSSLVLVVIAIGGTRLTHNDPGQTCLQIITDRQWLIDPSAETTAIDPRVNARQIIQSSTRIESPDGKHVAYQYRGPFREQGIQDTGDFELYLGTQGSQDTTFVQLVRASGGVFWAHNGNILAILWMDSDQLVHLTSVKVDGASPRIIDLPGMPDPNKSWLGWSPDDRYWAFIFQRKTTSEGL